MDWNDETIARLRTLWDEGHSTAEIGRRLNVSKNAVVGKAHRLQLPPRPSPIRRLPEGAAPARRATARRVRGPTLPPLRPMQAPVPEAPRPVRPVEHRVEAARPASVLRSVAPVSGGRVTSCCWPLGEPGTKTFRFCDDTSVPGKPYCADHAAVAYVKVRDRREEAA